MNETHDAGAITIGKAVELLQCQFPGVTASSLRFLQREGLIFPQRKASGHRLYSPDDIERIRTIKQWQADRIPLKEIRRRLGSLTPEQQLPDVVDQMTTHLLAGDLDAALEQLEQLDRAGTPLITLCEEVLAPVLISLGDDQGNHLIPVDMQFELDERLLRFLALATSSPAEPLLKPVVLAACPSWERHDMPLRMQTALLIERGASVHFVGSMVEKVFLLNAMARLSPDVILISMTITPRARVVSDWFEPVIAAMTSEQHLLVGGLGSGAAAMLEAENVSLVETERYALAIERVMKFGK